MLSNKVRDVDNLNETLTKLVSTTESEIGLRKAMNDATFSEFRAIK